MPILPGNMRCPRARESDPPFLVRGKLRQEAKNINLDASSIEITYDVKRGIPYEEILKEQEEKNIDLIVMASHGKTGIIKNLMGSVVEKVIRRAKCPLLLIRN